MLKSTERFTDRVESYVRYRPGYPSTVIETLVKHHGLSAASVVADMGSGPGQLAQLFLAHGCKVYGVEPNQAMRSAGELLLASFPHFVSVAGTAEQSGLADASMDLVAAGQAAHWFALEPACAEFRRVLRSGGLLALVWNERRLDDAFQQEYELLLQRFGTDYEKVSHLDNQLRPERFFANEQPMLHSFPNSQRLDFEGLQGRLVSSSYIPQPGDQRYVPMMAELQRLFDTYQHNGALEFLYTTQLYVGPVAA